MKPNVILIEVDQMRGDCLGIKEHPVVETPNLDMMAGDGALFNNAYSAVPSCIAARASILTGLKPKSHGRVGYKDRVPWNYNTTLAGEFADAGYHTQAIGKMHVYPQRNLMGFHNLILHDGYLGNARKTNMPAAEHWKNTDDYLPWLREKLNYDADMFDAGLDANSWVARPWIYPEHLHPTNWVVNQSIDFLRKKDPRKPFFLKMSFVRPHSPLDPPQVYYDRYINQNIPLPPIGEWADEDAADSGLNVNTIKGKMNQKTLKRALAAYYGLITHIDHQIGRFIISLKETNELKNTIMIFTSDHGDMLGDHNLFRKAIPYQGSVSVPFIVYDPGNNLDSEQGAVIDNIVELRDIMPTLLDMAGENIPETVEGKSLKPLIENEEIEWREHIHGEHSYGEDSSHYIVTEKDKYIWFSQTGEEQYFDLLNDPLEKKDLSETRKHKDRVKEMRNILIEELSDREEGYTDGDKLIVGQKAQPCLSHILE